MIEIRRPKENRRECNCCRSTTGVNEIYFMGDYYASGGTCVALCNECMNALFLILKKEITNEK